MSLMRRRLMASYSNNVGMLLHRWRGNMPFIGTLWADDVRTHHPIDWDVKNAWQVNDAIVTQSWMTLTTQALSSADEDFGKFFVIEINIGAFAIGNVSLPRYIIDIGMTNQNAGSIACAVYYQYGKMRAAFRIMNGTEINSAALGLDGIPYDFTSRGTIRFGVKNNGEGKGQFLLEQKNGAQSVSRPFDMPYIGKDIRWSSDYALLGRTLDEVRGDIQNPLSIKQLSIYKI